jgi:WD40-like Beta Propeller Repeat
VSVSAPPRLIEEARQRARRRRQIYASSGALVALVGIAAFMAFERTAPSQTASPALSVRVSLSGGTTGSKIASMSGKHYACCGQGGRGGLHVMNAEGTGKRVLKRHAWQGLVWSPDGRKIAFVGKRGNPGNRDWQLYVMNADGSGLKRLTHSPARTFENSLVWSPA